MSLSSRFQLSPDLAAETGIHMGDGGLSIKRGRPHGSYQYEVTGHALEDQLYLIGTVMPTVSAAYGLQRPGFYINPEQTWISLRYQSKDVALFKHEILGLPNGRKKDLSIPASIRMDPHLMRHLARELLATDGVLGFYNAGRSSRHKYPRIQIKLKACPAIEQLAHFLRVELNIHVTCRYNLGIHLGRGTSLQQILQVNRSEDIDTWRREIGLSNPSHMSRMMIFESLGECIPRTSIVDRLSFLAGRSSRLETSGPIIPYDLLSVVDKMRKSFGFPRLGGKAILQKIGETNEHLQSRLGRWLPVLVDS
jgi:hypothetical protein